MGWYNDPDFSWEDFAANNSGPAPACSIKRSAAQPKTSTSIETVPTSSTLSSGSGNNNTACPLPKDATPPPPPPDVDYIYHLCQKSKWMEANAKNQPYFPPTYIADGKFTRMTVHKTDLVDTANEYYKSVPGDWIVLEIDCPTLYSLGIAILAQDAPESGKKKQPVKCLQVFGGISTSLPGLVANIYKMKRSTEDGTFLELLEDPIKTSSSKYSSSLSSSTIQKQRASSSGYDEKKDEVGDSKPVAASRKKEQPAKEKKGSGFFSKLTKSRK